VVVDRLAFDLSIDVIIYWSERLGDRDSKEAVLEHLWGLTRKNVGRETMLGITPEKRKKNDGKGNLEPEL
jgi:hypothetical protein